MQGGSCNGKGREARTPGLLRAATRERQGAGLPGVCVCMFAGCVCVREWSAVEKTACACANGVQ
jgi:hypothetical protein